MSEKKNVAYCLHSVQCVAKSTVRGSTCEELDDGNEISVRPGRKLFWASDLRGLAREGNPSAVTRPVAIDIASYDGMPTLTLRVLPRNTEEVMPQVQKLSTSLAEISFIQMSPVLTENGLLKAYEEAFPGAPEEEILLEAVISREGIGLRIHHVPPVTLRVNAENSSLNRLRSEINDAFPAIDAESIRVRVQRVIVDECCTHDSVLVARVPHIDPEKDFGGAFDAIAFALRKPNDLSISCNGNDEGDFDDGVPWAHVERIIDTTMPGIEASVIAVRADATMETLCVTMG